MQHLTYIIRLYRTISNVIFSEFILKHLKLWLESGETAINQQKYQPDNMITNDIKISSAIVSLFAELQSTPVKFVNILIQIFLNINTNSSIFD
jgi:hypothetical protein